MVETGGAADDGASHPPTQEPTVNLIRITARRAQTGQGMTEYLIVVALIAVGAIGVYTLFGQTIRNQTAGLALEVAGRDAAPAISGARTNATAAQSAASVRKGLDNYNADNR
jgi:Tfp pilus assembly protein FimT